MTGDYWDFYLLGFWSAAQDHFWEFLAGGGVRIVHQEGKTLERCRFLMKKYRDLPMDLADAALVALAETCKVRAIFTLDHRDFTIYRPAHIKTFALIPRLIKKQRCRNRDT